MLTPAAAPVAASGHTMDLAESSIFLTVSVDEISGLDAPFFTATPTATEASGVAVLSTTLPEAITSGNGGCTIATVTIGRKILLMALFSKLRLIFNFCD